jgi:pimeloyl-ACP methyl ester carboxylesterase
VLLLAGLGCTAHVFAEPAPHLTDRFRVLGLTRRGHGLTDQVESGHALADAAEDARRLLDALGIKQAHLVGHSMGGGEASALAVRHPERVASVVYLDGAYDWADSPSTDGSDEAAGPDRFESYNAFVGFVRSLGPDFERNWGPALDAMFRTLVDAHADGSVTLKLPDAEAAPFVQAVYAFRHPYAEITAPALAIYAVGDRGQGDAATWRAASRARFASETVSGHVCEISDTSHYLFLDHRDEVLAAMRTFLTRPADRSCRNRSQPLSVRPRAEERSGFGSVRGPCPFSGCSQEGHGLEAGRL